MADAYQNSISGERSCDRCLQCFTSAESGGRISSAIAVVRYSYYTLFSYISYQPSQNKAAELSYLIQQHTEEVGCRDPPMIYAMLYRCRSHGAPSLHPSCCEYIYIRADSNSSVSCEVTASGTTRVAAVLLSQNFSADFYTFLKVSATLHVPAVLLYVDSGFRNVPHTESKQAGNSVECIVQHYQYFRTTY